MTANKLYLLLATRNGSDCLIFREALENMKIRTELGCVEDSNRLMEHFFKNHHKLPHIIFLETGLPDCGGLCCLKEIRENNSFSDVVMGVYSSAGHDDAVEEAFASGANIFLTKPADFFEMKNQLIQIITVFWQYHILGLRKDFFLLNV